LSPRDITEIDHRGYSFPKHSRQAGQPILTSNAKTNGQPHGGKNYVQIPDNGKTIPPDFSQNIFPDIPDNANTLPTPAEKPNGFRFGMRIGGDAKYSMSIGGVWVPASPPSPPPLPLPPLARFPKCSQIVPDLEQNVIKG